MVKSDTSIVAYGLVIVLLILVIVLVVMFCAKCSSKQSNKKGEKFMTKKFKNKKDYQEFNCAEDEYEYTTMFAGSNIASGCLQNHGGDSEEFKRTNKIACGNSGRYICQNITTNDGDSSIGCGCLEKMKKNDPRVIIPEKYIR
jgi:hypothetical protein